MYILKYNNDSIGKYKNTDEAWSKIRDYVENELKFDSYYYWCEYLENSDTNIKVDYGSNNNFFYIIKGDELISD